MVYVDLTQDQIEDIVIGFLSDQLKDLEHQYEHVGNVIPLFSYKGKVEKKMLKKLIKATKIVIANNSLGSTYSNIDLLEMSDKYERKQENGNS